jgi:hypothetical protein
VTARAFTESPGSLAWRLKQQQLREERLERERAAQEARDAEKDGAKSA